MHGQLYLEQPRCIPREKIAKDEHLPTELEDLKKSDYMIFTTIFLGRFANNNAFILYVKKTAKSTYPV